MADSRYRLLSYWEWALKERDIWQGFLEEPGKAERPILLNCALIEPRRGLVDNNWACYPNPPSVLGFIQYIFLPMVFRFLTHPEAQRLYIPIQSQRELVRDLLASGHPQARQMAALLRAADKLWALSPEALYRALPAFCQRLGCAISDEGTVLHIRPFFNTLEVGHFLRQSLWCDELFTEDIGITPQQFESFCTQFYKTPASQVMFVRYLNHKVGCVV